MGGAEEEDESEWNEKPDMLWDDDVVCTNNQGREWGHDEMTDGTTPKVP